MVKPQPPKIRLASAGTAASEVFNFYQIITLLSGLYIKGAQRQSAQTYKLSWDEASDSLVNQVGHAYDVWMATQKTLRDGLPISENQSLISRTARLAMRIVACESHLNMWCPAMRWGRIMALIERRILRLADELADHHPYVADKLAQMGEEIRRRENSMVGIESAAAKEARDLNSQYAIPVAM
jgi:hypothetical protein